MQTNIEITVKDAGFSLSHFAVRPFCAHLLVVVVALEAPKMELSSRSGTDTLANT